MGAIAYPAVAGGQDGNDPSRPAAEIIDLERERRKRRPRLHLPCPTRLRAPLARIHRPAHERHWILELEPSSGADQPLGLVQLRFRSREAAEAHAARQGWRHRVEAVDRAPRRQRRRARAMTAAADVGLLELGA